MGAVASEGFFARTNEKGLENYAKWTHEGQMRQKALQNEVQIDARRDFSVKRRHFDFE